MIRLVEASVESNVKGHSIITSVDKSFTKYIFIANLFDDILYLK